VGCSLPTSVARHQMLGKLPAHSLAKNIRKDVHHGVTRPTEVPGPFTFGGKALRQSAHSGESSTFGKTYFARELKIFFCRRTYDRPCVRSPSKSSPSLAM